MSKQQPIAPERRAFLKTAGLGVGAAAAVTAGAVEETKAAETAAPADGYRETAHIKRYYDLAKQF
jgi:nitrous oxide reductase